MSGCTFYLFSLSLSLSLALTLLTPSSRCRTSIRLSFSHFLPSMILPFSPYSLLHLRLAFSSLRFAFPFPPRCPPTASPQPPPPPHPPSLLSLRPHPSLTQPSRIRQTSCSFYFLSSHFRFSPALPLCELPDARTGRACAHDVERSLLFPARGGRRKRRTEERRREGKMRSRRLGAVKGVIGDSAQLRRL